MEAVFEELAAKHEVFRVLDRIAREDAVLATNTSAIPITQVAAVTERPERVVGTHFFSPVPMMALCELVRGHRTSDETLARARAFAEGVGKTCIVVNRDVAGFVTTRLICALVMEAVALAESGVASPEDIDIACKLGFGHAMGPLATTDLTGVDILHRRDAEHLRGHRGHQVLPAGAALAHGHRRCARPQERPGFLLVRPLTNRLRRAGTLGTIPSGPWHHVTIRTRAKFVRRVGNRSASGCVFMVSSVGPLGVRRAQGQAWRRRCAQ